MPALVHSLQNLDLGNLRLIAGFWGLDLNSNDVDSARKELATSLHNPKLTTELLASLSSDIRAALSALINAGGRLPLAPFVRQYGEIREMGAGQRDREHPHLKPASITEALFYRGLLARAFFDTIKGPQEFIYIPDDLLELINDEVLLPSNEVKEEFSDRLLELGENNPAPLGRPATPAERVHIIAANDRVLDDATTLLAARRIGLPASADPKLLALLVTTGLFIEDFPDAEKVKSFLEAPRLEALNFLIKAWLSSELFNELRLIPDLICEGEWINPILSTRKTLLDLLNSLPGGRWWSLAAFIHDVKERYPDFQRPAGDYDSWFIKRKSDGEYLRGFEHWNEVDGALIRFYITDILYWLGITDLACPAEGQAFTAFRLRTSVSPIPLPDPRIAGIEKSKLYISSQGIIVAPRLTPRAVRYQIARFCIWEAEKLDVYHYRLTPGSLTKAKEQGLKVEQLLALLAKHAQSGIPPMLAKALKRWKDHGVEAWAEPQIILRVSQPEILEKLRKSKAGRFLGEPLGQMAIVIKSGTVSKVMAALAEMGLLAEDGTAHARSLSNDDEPAAFPDMGEKKIKAIVTSKR
jgi:hypothetical protein